MFTLPRYKRRIDIVSPIVLDLESPGRIHTTGYPQSIADVGVDSNGVTLVEFYPLPSTTMLVRYSYFKKPTALTISATIPPKIDDYVLREGVLIDIYRAAKVNAISTGNIEAAATYGNEEQKQRTIWQKIMRDAFKTAQAANDKSFMLQNFGGTCYGGDIKTGRDYAIHEGYGS